MAASAGSTDSTSEPTTPTTTEQAAPAGRPPPGQHRRAVNRGSSTPSVTRSRSAIRTGAGRREPQLILVVAKRDARSGHSQNAGDAFGQVVEHLADVVAAHQRAGELGQSAIEQPLIHHAIASRWLRPMKIGTGKPLQ